MDCTRTTELINAYLDRELPGDEMLHVERHLAACAVCAGQRDQILQIKQLLGSLREPEPPCPFEPAQLDLPGAALAARRWTGLLQGLNPAHLFTRRAIAAGLAAILLGAGLAYGGARMAVEPSPLESAMLDQMVVPVPLPASIELPVRAPGYLIDMSSDLGARCPVCGQPLEQPAWAPPHRDRHAGRTVRFTGGPGARR